MFFPKLDGWVTSAWNDVRNMHLLGKYGIKSCLSDYIAEWKEPRLINIWSFRPLGQQNVGPKDMKYLYLHLTQRNASWIVYVPLRNQREWILRCWQFQEGISNNNNNTNWIHLDENTLSVTEYNGPVCKSSGNNNTYRSLRSEQHTGTVFTNHTGSVYHILLPAEAANSTNKRRNSSSNRIVASNGF